VARGSIFALFGSNSAGKTTVVNILSTLLKPDSGTGAVDRFDVSTQPANVSESISLTRLWVEVLAKGGSTGGRMMLSSVA
jgi:ABC-2 type transport system ATP-binding protein